MALHTILGANGTVSSELVPVLIANGEQVRLVSRNPKAVPGTTSLAADLEDEAAVMKAVEGSKFVYLLAGLKYDHKVWEISWPLIMHNVINACESCHAKLIFFDNVYMYGITSSAMTEETAFNPCSKKGTIRAAIANDLLNEMKQGKIRALIARSADFYGPVAVNNSVPNMLVFDNLRKGKKAQWLSNAHVPHSFTYVPDAAKALYMLACREDAFGQTWHLPTASNPLTGKAFIQLAAEAMQKPAKFMLLPSWMLKLIGLFNKTIKESYEMLYQSELPYYFDSTKFNKAFNFHPTSYEEGIKKTAAYISQLK